MEEFQVMSTLAQNAEGIGGALGALGITYATFSKRVGGSRAKTLKRGVLLFEKIVIAVADFVRTDTAFAPPPEEPSSEPDPLANVRTKNV